MEAMIIFLGEIIREHKGFGKQIFKLAKTELIKTYKGSALGPLWAIVKPSFQLFVYWFAFSVGIKKMGTVVVDINGTDLHFTRFLFMLVGLVPWFYISENITQGSKVIRTHRQFVTKVNFPVSTIMTYTALSRMFIHIILTFLMYIFVFFAWGPSWYNLQVFLYMPIMFLFFVFLSWSTAPMSAFSPDFENAVASFMTGVFWLSGIIYNSYDLPHPLDTIMLFNPVNFFVNGYRNCFLYNRPFFVYKTELVIFLAEFVVVFFLGVFNYNRLRKRIPDVL
jgi:ABC-type polysaccharide/polyol phosphate export permease